MHKYKVCVYAICKNEEKFIKKWVESMNEADEIYVLDTGSTDNSVKLLKELNVNVETKIITPWRFDTARNESLKLVPKDADICVCTDLDEVFVKGWREQLEQTWTKDTSRLLYTYNWSLDENNNPKVTFFREKIHSRNDYEWIYPVHEIPHFIGTNEVTKTNENIILNHYPDNTKSRSSYLKLLELSIKENPENDRNMHYLGREYMYYGRWNDCIDTLQKHLKLKKALWKDERAASMRFIARSYKHLNRIDESLLWYKRAINEAPYLKEGYAELMILYYELNDYSNAINYGIKTLQTNNNTKSYISENFSKNEYIYDILSLCFYYLNCKKVGLKFLELALEENPNNKRLQENKKYFE